MARRVHPLTDKPPYLTVSPYKAGPKAGEAVPEDTLNAGRSGDHSHHPGNQI